jgi:hypothetical protein
MAGRMVALRRQVSRAALAGTFGVSAWAFGAQDVVTGPRGLGPSLGVLPAAAAQSRAAEFTEVVDRVKPSVVGVRVKRDRSKDDETGGGPSSPDDPVGKLRTPHNPGDQPGRPQRPGAAAQGLGELPGSRG